ncbi:MAG: PrsW family intramembrane metalloprotease, partial [Thiotrichaceae bacterium]|nr:PrsW family intramembrane metalloprotease [Thiotrichaceae bacterium]
MLSSNYFFTIALGVLPSIIWLAFYLKKDLHPEPKKWLLLVFLAGMSLTPLVTIILWQISGFFNFLNLSFPAIFSTFLINIIIIFIGIAAIEELFKYLIVFFVMKHNPVFDEPEDAMIYMIVVALGFAAVENILVMNSFAPVFFFDSTQPLYVLALRFIGATFLHTLTSAIIGFYYALSLCKNDKCPTNPHALIIKGFAIAILL